MDMKIDKEQTSTEDAYSPNSMMHDGASSAAGPDVKRKRDDEGDAERLKKTEKYLKKMERRELRGERKRNAEDEEGAWTTSSRLWK